MIHTVGPVWRGGRAGEDDLLANCYRSSLSLALQNNIRTIAFPAISTGAFGFPLNRATRNAVGEVRAFLAQHPQIEHVTFVCFGEDARVAYEEALQKDD